MVQRITPEYLKDYAVLHGWRVAEEHGTNWLLLDPNDTEGERPQLIIPKDDRLHTDQVFLKGSLEILASTLGRPSYEIAAEIAILHDPVYRAARNLLNLARRIGAGELDPLDDCYVITEHQINAFKQTLDGQRPGASND